MKKLTIIVTGAGAPGIMGTIFSLRKNYDNREIKIIGTDIQNDVIGKYFCDKYYVIPKASDSENYLNTLLSICEIEGVDVVLPQNTAELIVLASNKSKFEAIGTSVAVSNLNSIEIANNKYKLMETCTELEFQTAKFYLVNNFNKLYHYAGKLGWPNKKIVVKPPISNGSRGVRIIDENINRRELFYKEKPTSLFITMEELKNILGDSFPELVVMEYISGEEYTVDVLRTEKKIVVIPRKRDLIRSGITFNATTERNEKIIEYSKKISEKINLTHCFGFQFIMDEGGEPKILECNPRVQGTMVLATFAGANIIYSSIKSSLGEDIPDFNIKWGTRILRYWGAIADFNGQMLHRI
ncbi:MAG: ATP-grasp domain-containing protein [Calditrichia bacterium]